MDQVAKMASKLDFIKFLTNEQKEINYNNKHFTKEASKNILTIKADGEVIYKIHKEKKILIVVKALYMTFLKDEYWGIAQKAGLEEIIADSSTLIRI